MQRHSTTFLILKKDLNSGLIRRKEYKDLIEYWIYNSEDTGLIDSQGQKISKVTGKLYCIIVCFKDHIQKETDKTIVVSGIRFTNDLNGNDLDGYLRDTKRGHNG